jgi:hypothetical protein
MVNSDKLTLCLLSVPDQQRTSWILVGLMQQPTGAVCSVIGPEQWPQRASYLWLVNMTNIMSLTFLKGQSSEIYNLSFDIDG